MKTVDGRVMVGETAIGSGDFKLKTKTVLNAEVG
jgi:hypothetical protein